jgi:cytochrome c-type biogenesis protein CcmH/NrfG
MTVAIIRLIILTSAMALLTLATPAHADWRRAESPNFIVYSQGHEGDLRRYTRNLEIYDYILRARMGLPAAATGRKLPIYLVRGRGGLVQIHPDTGPNVAGIYFPAGEDIFAAAINDREQDYLFHEYFHHFSLQLPSTSGYPGWLIEGLAEYFMTAEVSERSVAIGGYNENRVYGLFNTSWIPLDILLTKRFGEVRQGSQRNSYYPLAWLLTHWFMSEESRRGQLSAYIRDLQQGADSVAAMERATGLTLDQITQQLRRYRRLTIHNYTADFPETPITVTRLPASADDLLLIGQRLKVGVAEDQRAETAALVRRLAARHPDDPFAMLQLGHAELHFGDPDEGETILSELLEREPENVEALQLMATRYIRLAEDQPDEMLSLMRRARGFLARAYAADPAHYYTLQMLAETRQMAPDYPTENDLVAWDQAFQLAPQLTSIRLGFANALMEAEEFEQAVVILRPLANAAHGGQAAQVAATLMTRATNRQSPFTDAELDAASRDEVPDGDAGDEGDEANEGELAPPDA